LGDCATSSGAGTPGSVIFGPAQAFSGVSASRAQ